MLRPLVRPLVRALTRSPMESRGLRPTLSLDFTNGGVTDSRVTYSGGANGTRVNSAGLIVAATTPRFDYNPVTLAPLGLLVEEARTNLLLNSLLNGTNLSTQSVTVAATPYTLSFYGTGTVTLTGVSIAGPAVGTGAYPTRTTLTFTPTVGVLLLTVTGTVQFAQLEAGSFATSFIPTAGATVTRSADSAVMTGTNFSSWFNASEGTFVVEATPKSLGYSPLIVVSNDSYTSAIDLSLNGAGMVRYTVNDGVSADIFSGAAQTAASVKAAFSYATNDFILAANGALIGSDASGALPAAMTNMRIGGRFDGANANSWIKRITYFRGKSNAARLQALSAP